MNSMKFDFASPSNFSDWATYAGFDRKTGEIEPSRLSEAVKPPESFSDLIGQKTAGFQKTAAAVAPAMAQFGQGNMMQGINTLRGLPQQPASIKPDIHDYTQGIED